MRKLLLGLAVLPFLAGVSLAGQPQALTDQQMDKVAAGFDFSELDVNNVGVTIIGINDGAAPGLCGSASSGACFVNISGTTWGKLGGTPVQSFQLFVGFGP